MGNNNQNGQHSLSVSYVPKIAEIFQKRILHGIQGNNLILYAEADLE